MYVIMTVKMFAGIISVDVTFKLTSAYLVVVVIPHLTLKHRETGKPVRVLALAMLTKSKSKASFRTLPQFLFEKFQEIGVNMDALRMKLITDDEKALYQPWEEIFQGKIVHTLCSNHLRKSIKRKMLKLGISRPVRLKICEDIFGKTDRVSQRHILGLIDASDEKEYGAALAKCLARWPTEQWKRWYLRYQNKKIKNKMLLNVRSQYGTGTDLLTTNDCEGVNHQFKTFCGCRRSLSYVGYSIGEWMDFQMEMAQEAALYDSGPFEASPSIATSSFCLSLANASSWKKVLDAMGKVFLIRPQYLECSISGLQVAIQV